MKTFCITNKHENIWSYLIDYSINPHVSTTAMHQAFREVTLPKMQHTLFNTLTFSHTDKHACIYTVFTCRHY